MGSAVGRRDAALRVFAAVALAAVVLIWPELAGALGGAACVRGKA